MHKHLIHKLPSQVLFIMCWIVYGASYIGRINYSAALAGMIQDGTMLKNEAGLIGTAFFFCYGLGQLINGFLGDRLSPFIMVFLGLSGASLSNLFMSLNNKPVFLIIFWGINGLFQSMLWSPILYILSSVLREDMQKKACLRITTCVPVGAIAAYLMSMLILNYFHWKTLFAAAAIVLLAVLIGWTLTIIIIRKYLVPKEYKQISTTGVKLSQSGKVRLINLLLISGVLLMLLPAIMHGMIKEGVNVWVPTMLNELFSINAVFSLFLSMFLPLISVSGPYIITALYFKLFNKNEMLSAVFAFLSALPPLIALLFIDKLSVHVSIVLLSWVVTSMHGVNHVMVILIPVRFALYRKTASITGLVNSIIYLGCAIASYGFGWIAQEWGWQSVIGCCMLITITGALICLIIINRWTRFKEELKFQSDKIV